MPTLRVLLVVLVAMLAAPAGSALAAPPPNDGPDGAAPFEPVTAANGRPHAMQGIAELAEATPDPGVPRCLGPGSSQRTVWFRATGGPTPQRLTIEASGPTLAVADIAAFVQPEGVLAPLRRQPNACAGKGAGGADAAEEPTSGLTIDVPARRDVLFQVGARGAPGSADSERLVVSLDARPLPPARAPRGDTATGATPKASAKRGTFIALAHATVTQDEPADPTCPAFGSVWRQFKPTRNGPLLISLRGGLGSALSVYSGRAPSQANELDCVVRGTFGRLEMNVPAHRGRTLWIRVGADNAQPGAHEKLRLENGRGRIVVHGGPGGFDPTTGGPGGGLPASCSQSHPERARVVGGLGGSAAAFNARGVIVLRVAVRRAAICDVQADLLGPKGRVYASGIGGRLSGRATLRLQRTRRLGRGAYRLRITAVDYLGRRVNVRSTVRGRLR